LKEEALDGSVGRTDFGRGYGPVAGQTAKWRNVKNSGRVWIEER